MNKIKLFLKKFNRKGSDKFIYLATFVLISLGVVMIGSASIGLVSKNGTNYAMTRMLTQAIYVVIGLFFMVMISKKFKPQKVNFNFCLRLFLIVLAGMCICRGFADVNGSYAWIRIGGMTIQPAEFMKLTLILLVSYFVTETDISFGSPRAIPNKFAREKFIKEKRKICLLLPAGLVILACAVGILVQKDFGTTVILFSICFICFMSTPNKYYKKWKRLILLLGSVAVVVVVLASSFIFKGYQISRITSWLSPLENYYTSSFQLSNALIAFANGGLFGLGLGNSTQKFGYIPEAHNDFIGSIIFEELGILGLALMVVPTVIIAYRFLSYSARIKNSKQRIMLIGIASYFLIHMFVNLGGVSGLIPMTGVPLLLVSSGGSSTVSALCAIGIGQAIISRYNKEKYNL